MKLFETILLLDNGRSRDLDGRIGRIQYEGGGNIICVRKVSQELGDDGYISLC